MPVLVLTCPRSCSTVVTALLGCHPQVAALPEMKLFRRPLVAGLLRDWVRAPGMTHDGFRAGLLRGVGQTFCGGQTDEHLQAALAWLEDRRGWTGAQVLEALRAELAPKVVVEKSPENSGRQTSLDRLLRADVRVVHLVRHPITTAESLLRVWEPPAGWRMPMADRHQFALTLWYHHHRRVERSLADLDATRAVRVRAEDVVNDVAARRALARWIGVDDSDAAIEAMTDTAAWAYASPGPTSARGGGDPHFQQAPALRPVEVPASLDVPAGWQVDPWTQLAVAGLARSYGY